MNDDDDDGMIPAVGVTVRVCSVTSPVTSLLDRPDNTDTAAKQTCAHMHCMHSLCCTQSAENCRSGCKLPQTDNKSGVSLARTDNRFYGTGQHYST